MEWKCNEEIVKLWEGSWAKRVIDLGYIIVNKSLGPSSGRYAYFVEFGEGRLGATFNQFPVDGIKFAVKLHPPIYNYLTPFLFLAPAPSPIGLLLILPPRTPIYFYVLFYYHFSILSHSKPLPIIIFGILHILGRSIGGGCLSLKIMNLCKGVLFIKHIASTTALKQL